LYVVLHDGSEIDAFSTTSPYTKTKTISTGLGACPDTLARNGNALWFGYGCNGSGGIGSVDDATAVTPTVTLYSVGPYYNPFVYIPSSAQVLFVVDRGLSPCTL